MQINSINDESLRIQREYERRESEIDRARYAPWQPGEILMTSERKRIAARMLNEHKVFPKTGDRCMEIGYGRLGWLADLISWGVRETDLYGIELDAARSAYAQGLLPVANLKVGDACELPWDDNSFQYVIASTVFSSILNSEVRKSLADEITRVTCRGGVVIIYDLCVDNPGNKSLKKLKRSEVEAMLPGFRCDFRSITLVPPLARYVAKWNWTLSTLLSSLPFLRTHFLGIAIKV